MDPMDTLRSDKATFERELDDLISSAIKSESTSTPSRTQKTPEKRIKTGHNLGNSTTRESLCPSI